MSLSSYFFPSFPNGQAEAFFDGMGDPKKKQNIEHKSSTGKLLLQKLLTPLGNYIFGSSYTGVENLKYSRSVFTFCRRPGQSRGSENTKYTKMAMEIGEQIEKNAQTGNVRVYFGGDFLFEAQISKAAIHDVLVMGVGLILVGLFTWFHFQSLFLAFIVALQIILSFTVTYFVYRILLDIPKVPIIMLLGKGWLGLGLNDRIYLLT